MKQIRENILRSFALVRRDVLHMQVSFAKLAERNQKLEKRLQDATKRDRQLSERITTLRGRLSKVAQAKRAKAVVRKVSKRRK